MINRMIFSEFKEYIYLSDVGLHKTTWQSGIQTICHCGKIILQKDKVQLVILFLWISHLPAICQFWMMLGHHQANTGPMRSARYGRQRVWSWRCFSLVFCRQHDLLFSLIGKKDGTSERQWSTAELRLRMDHILRLRPTIKPKQG